MLNLTLSVGKVKLILTLTSQLTKYKINNIDMSEVFAAPPYTEKKSFERDFFNDAADYETSVSNKIELRQQETLRAVENMRRFGFRVAFFGVVLCAVLSYFIK